MTIDLARIKKAAEKATKGPWKAFKTPTGLLIGIGEETGEGITDARGGLWGDAEEAVRNADHIVAAHPQTVLALVAAVKAARDVLGAPYELFDDALNELDTKLQPFTVTK